MPVPKRPCWNCSSPRFIETIGREECPACGIACFYHGAGANEAYKNASRRRHEEEEARLQEESDREWEGF